MELVGKDNNTTLWLSFKNGLVCLNNQANEMAGVTGAAFRQGIREHLQELDGRQLLVGHVDLGRPTVSDLTEVVVKRSAAFRSLGPHMRTICAALQEARRYTRDVEEQQRLDAAIAALAAAAKEA